jgi:hypothetical protein
VKIHETGLWRILGEKEYGGFMTSHGITVPVDPRMTSVVEDTAYQYSVFGSLDGFSVTDGSLENITLVLMDASPYGIDGIFPVESVWTLRCLSQPDCTKSLYVPSELEDLTEGNLVQLEFIRYHGDQWKIANLYIRPS